METGISVLKHWSWINQETLGAVARQRGFVVRSSCAGITFQFPCGSGSEVYLPVCVREGEGRVYSRLWLSAEYPVHPTDQIVALPSGGECRINLGFVC